jgi:hypothetical protein
MAIIIVRSYSSPMPAADSREDEASRTRDHQKHKPGEGTSGRLPTVFVMLSAVWGLEVGLGGLPWRKSVAFALIGVAVIPVAVAFTRARDWGWPRWVCAWGASVALVAGAVFVFLLPAARPEYADIGFTPHARKVPYCSTFEGHGSIPRGYKLLIFAQAGGAGGAGAGGYAYEGAARPGDGNWSISNIPLGAQNQVGHSGELTALLVTSQLASFVQPGNMYFTPPSAYLEWIALPPGIQVSRFYYVRNSNTDRCPS